METMCICNAADKCGVSDCMHKKPHKQGFEITVPCNVPCRRDGRPHNIICTCSAIKSEWD